MESIRLARLRTRFSLAVCLLDANHTDNPRLAGAAVTLEGVLSKPVRKASGWFIFTDLQEGTYRLNVNIPDYFSESIEIVVDAGHPVVYVPLIPLPSYPFVEGATLLRVCFRNNSGLPVAGVRLTAVVVSESCARARIAQDEVQPGAVELPLGQVTGGIAPGSLFLIRGRDPQQQGERCVVESVADRMRAVKLTKPLASAHSRGDLLLPVVETRSDERGEAVVAFPGCRAKTFDVALAIAGGASTLAKEVTLAEGKTANLGTLHL